MKISVALCTYNGEKFIIDQLQSIIDQTMPVDEIIICDDRSKDSTIPLIRDFLILHPSSVDVKIIINEKQLGVTKNFEKALSLCTGDYIFLCDQDDCWDKGKVSCIIDLLSKQDECLLVFTDAFLINARGEQLPLSLWEVESFSPKEQYCMLDFLGLRFVTGATVAIKKELLEYTLPIPECWIHDAWLAINASLYGKVLSLNNKLISYRQHESNVIGAKKRGFLQQVSYTKKNIQKSIQFRLEMKKRYTSFLKKNIDVLSYTERAEIEKCITFWTESEGIIYRTLWDGLSIIFKNIRNKNYIKYNHGIYGALVDLFILIVS